jgi:hypothetical protein
VADLLDYLVTLARLRIVDGLAGPLPETAAGQRRERERERERERLEIFDRLAQASFKRDSWA